MKRDSPSNDKVDPEERASRFITNLLENDQSRDAQLGQSQGTTESGTRKTLPRSISWGEWDVPLGRSQEVREHIGNKRYRQLVEKHRQAYLSATRRADKTFLTTTIFATINANGGRFLNKQVLDDGSENWFEISEEKALAKISQALRMGTGKQSSARGTSPEDSPPSVSSRATTPEKRRESVARAMPSVPFSIGAGSTPPPPNRQIAQPWSSANQAASTTTPEQLAASGSSVPMTPFSLGGPLMTPPQPQMQPWAAQAAAAATTPVTSGRALRRDTEPRKLPGFPPLQRQHLPRRHSLPTLYSPIAQAPSVQPPDQYDVDLANLSLEYWDSEAEQMLSEQAEAATDTAGGQEASGAGLPSASLQLRARPAQQQQNEQIFEQPQELTRTLTDEVGDDDFSVDELFLGGEIFDLEPIPVFSHQASDQEGNNNRSNENDDDDNNNNEQEESNAYLS